MTINVKVTVPETAKWRALVITQDRPYVEGEPTEYAEVGQTTLEPGTSQDYAVTNTRRILVEEIPLAKSADAEADETENSPESNAG